MVGVAQLVEHQVVALVAAGSIPVTHPIKILKAAGRLLFLLVTLDDQIFSNAEVGQIDKNLIIE